MASIVFCRYCTKSEKGLCTNMASIFFGDAIMDSDYCSHGEPKDNFEQMRQDKAARLKFETYVEEMDKLKEKR